MPRVVWKGAIAFGLVNIPVSLYPGARAQSLDFDMLDKRDFAPIGYRRINKRTGEEVANADIVKGYEYEDGQYVVVTDEDFKRANVKATQTVDILAFVNAAEIPPYYFDTPYYLEPGKRGEKGYALLRDTLKNAGLVGVANVVLRSRQHLAAVIPVERALVLMTMRFADEVRPLKELELPDADAAKAGVTAKEMEMAARLVEDMTEAWAPDKYHDTYREDLLAEIERKVQAGQTQVVTEAEEGEPARGGAQIIDLMAMLKRSLDTSKKGERGAGGDKATRGAEKEKGEPPTRRAAAGREPERAAKRSAPVKRARKRA
jgi:DNA end-binding protein Ku